MADETIKQETIACPSCGGDLGKSARTEGSGEDAEEVPIARCLSCGKEYDRRTDVYYRVYELMFAPDAGTSPFKLGAKGMLGGVEYEIIGRIRYQDEDEYELDVWDEWLAVSAEGGYVWFVEEEGRVFSYSEYTPESIDLEASGKNFEFEGRHYSKEDTGFVARIVFAEGELSWRPRSASRRSAMIFPGAITATP
jgi:DNA-directed RNA polymerase subunit RPC12/RpoP